MTDRFRVVPAAYVVLRRAGESGPEVLLQLRRHTGYRDGHWACGAAGHVELGESALEAAVREASEEIGVRIDPVELRALTVMHRTHGNGRPVDERVDFFFLGDRWEGEPTRLEGDRSADLRWFPLNALPAPVVPHESAVLTALARGEQAVPRYLSFGFDRA